MDTCTALAFVLPERYGSKVEPIRRSHDKAYVRWMPHINFLFPFFPERTLDSVAERLTKDLANVPAFILNLDEIGFFPIGYENTYHLSASDSSQMKALYDSVRKTLHEFKQAKRDFHPHLTLGQWSKPEDPTAMLKESVGSVEVLVDRLYIITRTKDGPFTIRNEIPLGAFSSGGFEE